jgi:hypothetical protein
MSETNLYTHPQQTEQHHQESYKVTNILYYPFDYDLEYPLQFLRSPTP